MDVSKIKPIGNNIIVLMCEKKQQIGGILIADTENVDQLDVCEIVAVDPVSTHGHKVDSTVILISGSGVNVSDGLSTDEYRVITSDMIIGTYNVK